MYGVKLFRTALTCGASRYGITLDDNTISLFERYTEVLRSWNLRSNLVSSGDMERFVEYHLLDSLKVASCFDFTRIHTLLDFGSGAGLPGVPLALAFPHIHATLVDSRLKRCMFLKNLLHVLSPLHATILRSRLENLPESYNKSFDVVITRATTSLKKFFRGASRFISNHGSLVAIKGDTIDTELYDLLNIVDLQLFNISSTAPTAFENVRQGSVVIITRR